MLSSSNVLPGAWHPNPKRVRLIARKTATYHMLESDIHRQAKADGWTL